MILATTSSWVVPVVTALAGAAVGLLGGGLIRLLLDRRQELVRAQAYARVIHDELTQIENRLTTVLDEGNLWAARVPLPTSAWHEHRAAVAAAVTDVEFFALATCYRIVENMNAEIRSGGARRRLLERVFRVTSVEEELIGMMAISQRLYVPLAISSIKWLAEGNAKLWRRRRTEAVLSPDPNAPCRCGHTFWDHERRTRKRHLRVRHRSERMVDRAYACGVEGCSCRRFRYAGSRWAAPLRRIRALPQAPYVTADLGDDSEAPAEAESGRD
jgi:hypothetical protein